jgi:hypothetical protein
MRQIRNAALALALVGVLAGCSDDETTSADTDADETTTAAAPECRAVGYHHDSLDPGCWAIKVRGLVESPLAGLDLPAGFSGNDAWVWTNPEKDSEWGAITLLTVGDMYRDPCARTGRPLVVGPTVEDFTSALADQLVTTTTTPVPVSLDGHDGVYVEVSAPRGFHLSSCRGKSLTLWESAAEEAAGIEPGQVRRYWAVDVDGQRVVLSLATNGDATDETVEFFTGIAESATFGGT